MKLAIAGFPLNRRDLSIYHILVRDRKSYFDRKVNIAVLIFIIIISERVL